MSKADDVDVSTYISIANIEYILYTQGRPLGVKKTSDT